MEKKDIREEGKSVQSIVKTQPEPRLKWEPPMIKSFSVDAVDGAVCVSGSSPTSGTCSSGYSASGVCSPTGNSAGSTCSPGSMAGNTCTTGNSAIGFCLVGPGR